MPRFSSTLPAVRLFLRALLFPPLKQRESWHLGSHSTNEGMLVVCTREHLSACRRTRLPWMGESKAARAQKTIYLPPSQLYRRVN